ncbi:MAG: hypothetical protein ABI824_09165 [Acidobacteriota bacterium]
MAKLIRLTSVVVVSLLFILWRTSILLQPASTGVNVELSEGDQMCLSVFNEGRDAGHDFFIIATDALCPYCEESKPFQLALEEFGAPLGIQTLYLFTDGLAGEPLAERYQAAGKSIIRARTSEIGIRYTPTFIRVSSKGVVKAIWIGAGTTESAKQLAWTALTRGKDFRFENATSADLSAAANGSGAAIVGFSKSVLASYPKAKYFDEVSHFVERAESELDKGRGVILDCQSTQSLDLCRSSARALFQKGFSDMKTIGMPSRTLSTCPGRSSLLDRFRPRG